MTTIVKIANGNIEVQRVDESLTFSYSDWASVEFSEDEEECKKHEGNGFDAFWIEKENNLASFICFFVSHIWKGSLKDIENHMRNWINAQIERDEERKFSEYLLAP
jgi:hypothetical protein